jgi:hypothetical protein
VSEVDGFQSCFLVIAIELGTRALPIHFIRFTPSVAATHRLALVRTLISRNGCDRLFENEEDTNVHTIKRHSWIRAAP